MNTVEKILDLMQSQNIGAFKLENDLRLANGTVGKWKKGVYKPSAEAIGKIADYFNVSVDFLLGREQEKQQNEKDISDDIRYYCASCQKWHSLSDVCKYDRYVYIEGVSQNGTEFKIKVPFKRLQNALIQMVEKQIISNDEKTKLYNLALERINKCTHQNSLLKIEFN